MSENIDSESVDETLVSPKEEPEQSVEDKFNAALQAAVVAAVDARDYEFGPGRIAGALHTAAFQVLFLASTGRL